METPEARIAEAIQRLCPVRQPFEQAIVLDLVQEQARFLAFQKVHRHSQAVHLHDKLRRQFPPKDAPFPNKALALTHWRIIAGHDGPGSEDLLEGLHDEIPATVHPGGQNLDHQGVAVAIHDQAWQPVRFAMDHAVGRPFPQRLFPPGLGLPDAVHEKVAIDGGAVASEETDGDRGARIDVAASEKAPAAVHDVHQVAGFHARRPSLDFVPINPRVPGQQAGFFSRFQRNGMDGFHGIATVGVRTRSPGCF